MRADIYSAGYTAHCMQLMNRPEEFRSITTILVMQPSGAVSHITGLSVYFYPTGYYHCPGSPFNFPYPYHSADPSSPPFPSHIFLQRARGRFCFPFPSPVFFSSSLPRCVSFYTLCLPAVTAVAGGCGGWWVALDVGGLFSHQASH